MEQILNEVELLNISQWDHAFVTLLRVVSIALVAWIVLGVTRRLIRLFRECITRSMDDREQIKRAEHWPVRVVCEPIPATDPLWRAYMSRHLQNLEWQYHNGGIWPLVGGFWVAALALAGESERAGAELAKLARANALDNWSFHEWLHGRTLAPGGMRGQSWNAAAFLIALDAVRADGAAFLLRPR